MSVLGTGSWADVLAEHAATERTSQRLIAQLKRDHIKEQKDVAVAYARAGWRVIALYAMTPGGCVCKDGIRCKSPGKHPLEKYSPHAANDPYHTPEEIEKWEKVVASAEVRID